MDEVCDPPYRGEPSGEPAGPGRGERGPAPPCRLPAGHGGPGGNGGPVGLGGNHWPPQLARTARVCERPHILFLREHIDVVYCGYYVFRSILNIPSETHRIFFQMLHYFDFLALQRSFLKSICCKRPNIT